MEFSSNIVLPVDIDLGDRVRFRPREFCKWMEVNVVHGLGDDGRGGLNTFDAAISKRRVERDWQ